ncbi:MAG: 16S rRNA (guanine(527)-N(7))-methyltransferase RsmG [Alphaproteobacteria bacterium]
MAGGVAAPWPAELDAAFALLNVSRETSARLGAYVAALEKWNRSINLVSARSLREVWRRHVLDSAQLVPLLPPDTATIVDLGSGAGLPGGVIACLHPARVHMIEADRRKAIFLGEMVRSLRLDAVVHASRIDAVRGLVADVVTARALAPLPELLALAAPFLAEKSQCLFLKSQDIASELTAATKHWRFDATQTPSISDRRGLVLRIRHVERR